jgi:galactokinase
MDERVTGIKQSFEERFGMPPGLIVRAPGRVNLLGEHTDYNDGFVLPIAINRDILMAVRARPDRTVNLHSVDFCEDSSFELDRLEPAAKASWSNYFRGVALMLERTGIRLAGLDGVLSGNVPIASGLSSSAAMEIGSALVFQKLTGFEMAPVQMALLAQKAEHEFIGVLSGIMDQYICRMGRKDHALLIDCRSLESRLIPVAAGGPAGPGNASADHPVFVVGDTRVRRELVGSEYNVRRSQCEQAVEQLRSALPDIKALRDVSSEELNQNEALLSDTVLRRARHVVSEDERVLRGVEALERGELAVFGRLMNESHDSLRNDYEVSSPELDTIVDAARTVPGVLGSRMTGAGFGGCTVSLVESDAVPEFERVVGARYRAAFSVEPSLYICTAEDGAHVVERL